MGNRMNAVTTNDYVRYTSIKKSTITIAREMRICMARSWFSGISLIPPRFIKAAFYDLS